MFDALVIGGGFYGCMVGLRLKRLGIAKSVLLVEQEQDILMRASANNQARVHGGYHYPRSITTGVRSRTLLEEFRNNFSEAIYGLNQAIYAIPRSRSLISAQQFEKYCYQISAPLKRAGEETRRLFDMARIDGVYEVDEPVFDVSILRQMLSHQLKASGIEMRFNTRVAKIVSRNGETSATLESANSSDEIQIRKVYSCTYGDSGIEGDVGAPTGFKYELAEMALVKPPREIDGISITVMDGPFFSIVPYPTRRLHTLSHVTYTPHFSSTDSKQVRERLQNSSVNSTNFERMIRSAAQLVPIMIECIQVESIFEIKCIQLRNEENDARPIIFEPFTGSVQGYNIVGGKIDNVFDALNHELLGDPFEDH